MIESVTKDTFIKTHVLEVEPSHDTKMFAKTRCGQLIHSSNMESETVESVDEIRDSCKECIDA